MKELIPEAYYLPEAFHNANDFNLGVRQTGERVHDVVLPQWAKGSSQTFVRTMRAALESEHVSASLHLWIDLIFGCRQQGAPAAAARNAFFHLTYEGAVDITALHGHDRDVRPLAAAPTAASEERSVARCCAL